MRYCAHAPQTGGKTVPNPGRTQLGGKIIHHPTVLYPLKRVTKFHNAIPFFLRRKIPFAAKPLVCITSIYKKSKKHIFSSTIGSVKDRKNKRCVFFLGYGKNVYMLSHMKQHTPLHVRLNTYGCAQIPISLIRYHMIRSHPATYASCQRLFHNLRVAARIFLRGRGDFLYHTNLTFQLLHGYGKRVI